MSDLRIEQNRRTSALRDPSRARSLLESRGNGRVRDVRADDGEGDANAFDLDRLEAPRGGAPNSANSYAFANCIMAVNSYNSGQGRSTCCGDGARAVAWIR